MEMDMHAHTLSPALAGRAPQAGFADPAVGAQAAFRVALEALAHPGRVLEIEADCGVPAGMSPAMVALLLTLVDVDTPLWLPAGVDDEVRAFLRFHCGCSMVDQPGEARFAALPRGHRAPALSLFNPGDSAYPDQSATLLIEATDLERGRALTLSGPGIQDRAALHVDGLEEGFWREWRLNHQRFPLGVDLFLTQGRRICGLPRSTRVEN